MPLQTFGDWIAKQSRAELSDEIAHHATRAFLDWMGAAIAGGGEPPAVLLTRAFAAETPNHGATLIPGGQRTDARTAALINGTASHTVEVDDIFRDGIYHPGSPTVAAVLALAEPAGSSGRDVLSAIAVGYEVGTRIAAAIQPSHYRFWHTTGTVGAIGAAAGAAAAIGLDGEQSGHALATATTLAAGLQQAFRSDAMSKPLHAGHAAQIGVLAALACREGFTGALDVLDGPAGFGAAMSEEAHWDGITAELGSRWNITKATFKFHAACGHTFAPVDIALVLREKYDLTPERIRWVRVETAETPARTAGIRSPKTPFEAKFSIPYTVASAFVRGHVQVSAFTPEALMELPVRELQDKVEVVVDDAMTKTFPGVRSARLHVTTVDGEEIIQRADTRKGDPDSPLTDRELTSKFVALATPVLGAAEAQSLQQRLWRTADSASVSELFPSAASPT